MSAIVNARDVLLQAASPRLEVVATNVAGYLTSDTFTAPASSAGVVSSFTGAGGTFKVFNGTTDVTTSCTFSILSNPDTLTASIGASSGVYAVTAAGSWASGSRVTFLTLRATYAGVAVDKVFTLTKAIAGTNGSNGANGADGSNGANGQRGTVNIAATTAGTTWSDPDANAAISAAGYGSPVNRDVVTLYNSAAHYSGTSFYSSGSWLPIAAYINGNLFIDGTASATFFDGVGLKIGTGHTPGSRALEINSAGTVYADNIYGAVVIASNIDYTGINPVSGFTYGNVEAIVGQVAAANAGGAAHGVRGYNYHTNAGGIIGGGNNYDFYADGTGGGTNYGPFTGAHDALVPKAANGWSIGDIVVDVVCVARRGVSNTIFEAARSTSANQRAAIGIMACDPQPLSDYPPAALIGSVTQEVDNDGHKKHKVVAAPGYDALQQKYNRIAMNALGEGQINVCGQGGNIAAGDLIVASDRPGKGMRQADDVVRSYTVARAREAVTFSGPGDVKLVACIYLCG